MESKIQDFTIKCYPGTSAEQYAKNNGFEYELLNGPYDSSSPEKEMTIGDVSADGTIGVEDAVMIVNSVNGIRALREDEIKRADVDNSGKVDIEDTVRIINHINGVKTIR